MVDKKKMASGFKVEEKYAHNVLFFTSCKLNIKMFHVLKENLKGLSPLL